MRGGCARDRAGPVNVHFYAEVITVAGPRHLNLAVPIADRIEEEIYFGLSAGTDTNLACRV
jgi:hypothetical protein